MKYPWYIFFYLWRKVLLLLLLILTVWPRNQHVIQWTQKHICCPYAAFKCVLKTQEKSSPTCLYVLSKRQKLKRPRNQKENVSVVEREPIPCLSLIPMRWISELRNFTYPHFPSPNFGTDQDIFMEGIACMEWGKNRQSGFNQ